MTRDDDDATLRPHLEALPREITPPTDLWPAVEARIRRGARPRWTFLAAAAVLLVAVTASITTIIVREPGTAPGAGASGILAVVEADYATETAALRAVLDAERERLAPETVAALERNLAVIDGAIAESREALARDPANPDLRVLLRASYAARVALLEQATRVARDI